MEFPLWKDPKLAGPPWGLRGVHWNLLAEGGDGIVTGDEGQQNVASGETKGEFLRELHMKPETSYKQGRGEDMLSVWRRIAE